MNKKFPLVFEKICFFISSMSIFGLVYCIKFLSLFWDNQSICSSFAKIDIFGIICLIFSFIIFIVGIIIFLCFIMRNQDIVDSKTENALLFKVSKLTNKNDSGVFSKISLFILTGLSLPIKNERFSLLLLTLFLIIMCIFYVRTKSISINPLFALFGYNIYSGKPEQKKENGEITTFSEKTLLIRGELNISEFAIDYTTNSTVFIKIIPQKENNADSVSPTSTPS